LTIRLRLHVHLAPHKETAHAAPREARPSPATVTKLGDWKALNLRRERLVLCVSALTLLPVVVPAIGVDLDAKLDRAG
jgi:hypothetical protein